MLKPNTTKLDLINELGQRRVYIKNLEANHICLIQPYSSDEFNMMILAVLKTYFDNVSCVTDRNLNDGQSVIVYYRFNGV
jgi:hypothetical protein